jgi:hypothetical protein
MTPVSTFEDRLRSRAQRDPYYQGLAAASSETLLAAGCFIESYAGDIREHPCWNVRMPTTPVGKVREALQSYATEDARPPVVLLSTGCFSPVHQGHLAMMEAAKTAVQASGRRVVGGYLSPAHDEYASAKLNGSARMHAENRIALLEEAVWDSTWLSVCPWEARYTPAALNFTDVLDRLRYYLRAQLSREVEVAYVFGSDNAGFARAFQHRGLAVCVLRGPPTPEIRALQDECTAELEEPPRVLWAGPTSHAYASSTRVRAGESWHLPIAIQSKYSVLRQASRPEPNSPKSIYLVRQDIAYAVQDWPEVPATAIATFHAELSSVLTRALANTDCRVHALNLETQLEIARDLVRKGKVLSLDACVSSTAQLHVSRRFEICDGQVRSSHMLPRPGHSSIAVQLNGLPSGGTWTVLDDDRSTGQTEHFVQRLLAARGANVSQFAYLNEKSLQRDSLQGWPVTDVVDARDFLLGARDAGLVVSLADGSISRSPYMLPFVNLLFRARLPANAVQRVSSELWALNARWFAKLPRTLCVRDAHGPSQGLLYALGFQAGTPLQAVSHTLGQWLNASASDLQAAQARGAQPQTNVVPSPS